LNEARIFLDELEVPHFVSSLPYRPLISIILPTYNTPVYFLERCLQSVLDQQYWNWQLCIADDNSTHTHVIEMIKEHAGRDSRIHVDRNLQQGGISAASNLALQAARGEFVVLLDHDDELHPSALIELVRTLNEHTGTELIYSDEDKIDQFGIRSQPAFKPDFDRNVFLSFNYLGHLIALKRSVVTQIGGFRTCCDGAQEWDLLIRATETIPDTAIRHICKPLYHWRIHENSTSTNLDAKPYVAKAWMRVLEDHVRRTNKSVHVSPGLFYGSMRLKYASPRDVQIGVIVRPEDGLFQAAVVKANSDARALHVYELFGCEVINQLTHERALTLSDLRGDIFVFINGPLECLSHLFFEEVTAQLSRADCGMVTGMALDWQNKTLPTGYLQIDDEKVTDPYAGVQIPNHGYMGQASVVREVQACSGLFFAVRRELLEDIGGVAAMTSFDMHRLGSLLARNVHEKGLAILYTPYAVASFSAVSIPQTRNSIRGGEHNVTLNPHVLTLENLVAC
jgi:glycosyltransferase involved in cell wall biosynthesis